jgi:hypothetical protein
MGRKGTPSMSAVSSLCGGDLLILLALNSLPSDSLLISRTFFVARSIFAAMLTSLLCCSTSRVRRISTLTLSGLSESFGEILSTLGVPMVREKPSKEEAKRRETFSGTFPLSSLRNGDDEDEVPGVDDEEGREGVEWEGDEDVEVPFRLTRLLTRLRGR